MKSSRGITLIALVVTIIVLLILAGITISLVIGQNGIITRANEASIRQDNGTVMEAINMIIAGEKIEQRGGDVDAIRFLQNNTYLDSNGIVNVTKVVGKELKTGRGSSNDIYTIEGSKVYYTDKNGNKTELGEIETSVLEETSPDYFEFNPNTGTIWLKGMKITEQYYTNPDYTIDIDTVVVPSQIDGVPVTSIGDWGMAVGNIKKVILPDTITSIGIGAFDGSYNPNFALEEVVLSKNTETICAGAFQNCKKLKKIELPNRLDTIMYNAFQNCIAIPNVVIPSSVAYIAKEAFSGWTSSQTINIDIKEQPSGWNSNWNLDCNAIINWKQ